MLYVCSLADLHTTVEKVQASHVLTIMANVSKATTPASIRPENHLRVSVDDIIEPADGFTPPNAQHVEQVLTFARNWDRRAPLVVHCFAGISRSTASAFAAACMLNPQRSELEIARQIRSVSSIAFPNRLIVALADQALQRDGRMIRAIDDIGPGDMSVINQPFIVHID